MKKFQILGPGCARCKKLAEVTDACASELGMDYNIEKVTDLTEIINAGVMQTPAVVVDGKILHEGSVPSKDEMKQILQKNL
jgi:small redox-active disulfide protein 2